MYVSAWTRGLTVDGSVASPYHLPVLDIANTQFLPSCFIFTSFFDPPAFILPYKVGHSVHVLRVQVASRQLPRYKVLQSAAKPPFRLLPCVHRVCFTCIALGRINVQTLEEGGHHTG